MSSSGKTEKATPRRRQKAREKGQVARSRELATALATLGAGLLLAYQARTFPGMWRGMLAGSLTTAETLPVFAFAGAARTLGLLMAGTWLLAVVSSVAQGGLVFAPTALAPAFGRLNPASRLEQLFSLQSLGRLSKSLVPVAAVSYLAFGIVLQQWPAQAALAGRNGAGLLATIGHTSFAVIWQSALVLLAWAGVDYWIEHHKLESELRMSRQELVDEFKETEGNPAVKARIRRLQRQVRRQRMLRDVEKATVVVTNPTEFAIALEYRPLMAAPLVVAKGRNLLAAEIKRVARWHGIPLVENPPLAHALYRTVEVGQSIPPKLYRVVAEVLAAIYRIQRRHAGPGNVPEGV